MANGHVNPALKAALEFGPVLGFFVAYLALKDRSFEIGAAEYEGFVVVTAGFIPVVLAATGTLWALTGRLSRMQAVTAVLIVVFGGLSVWLNDPRFFKMKPTMVYLLFGGTLGLGLLLGKSWLRAVMGEIVPLTPQGWTILTRRLTAFFLAFAVLNELVWRTMSEESWVYFKTFGLPGGTFVFFMLQTRLFQTHHAGPSDDAP